MRIRPRIALPAGLLAATLLLPAVPAVAAPPLAAVAGQAAALRVAVDRLQLQAEIAVEDYNAVSASLDAVSARRVLLDERRDDLAGAADAQRAEVNRHVRALYLRGGDLGMLGALLDGDRPETLLSSAQAAEAAVRRDADVVRGADALVTAGNSAARDAAAQETRQRLLAADLAARAADVEGLLARSAALLASADSDVRRLADAERLAAEQRAARLFQSRLPAAGQAGPGAGSLRGAPGGGAASGVSATAIAAARSRLGAPYVWAAEGPDAFDCSGLTSWAYAQAGVRLPRTSRQQWWAGTRVAVADLQPGDLLFWANDVQDPRTIHHVAIYLGGGLMLAAPHTGDVVKIQPVYDTGYIGAVRPQTTAP